MREYTPIQLPANVVHAAYCELVRVQKRIDAAIAGYRSFQQPLIDSAAMTAVYASGWRIAHMQAPEGCIILEDQSNDMPDYRLMLDRHKRLHVCDEMGRCIE